jgi:hypothetical protein
MAMGSIKTKFRKAKGDAKKMHRYFETGFKRLKDIVKENKDKIYSSPTNRDKLEKYL